MKQKTIKTDKATVLVVETPEGITEVTNTGKRLSIPDRKGGHLFFEGNWQLIGRMPDITEEQSELIVESWVMPLHDGSSNEYYKDYVEDIFVKDFAIEALSSLLQANEIYFENPVKLPNYDMKYMTSRWTYYGADILKHREAQSKVWDKERCYLFIKVD